jgi:catechol 2,3-dioxygenase-like lactoylglutathione lyase family enzyme
MKIDAIDHVVLTVKDIEATCAFYTRALGMTAVTFAPGRKALAFGSQKFNLHQQGKEFEPKALNPTPGSADLCLITALEMTKVISHLQACGVDLLEGPVKRTGAVGTLVSVYFPRSRSESDRSLQLHSRLRRCSAATANATTGYRMTTVAAHEELCRA